MKRCLLTFLICLFITGAKAQFKNDNVLYRTLFPSELCKYMESNPGYLLLDVRSPGEFADSSRNFNLNIGHLKDAINIDIRQISNRINAIKTYRNKPVFVYCSHSQRSRRVSKMLADSGFTQVYNINGGMTAMHLENKKANPCLQNLVVGNPSYSLVSPAELCAQLNANVMLLDVRPDSLWHRQTGNERWNAIGYLKGAKHISLEQLKTGLTGLDKNRPVIITDISGYDAGQAAGLLQQNGFTRVSVLVEGLGRWLSYDQEKLPCRDLLVPVAGFGMMNTFDLARKETGKEVMMIDVRTNDEYANRHKDVYRNIGHVKNAVHIPFDELEARVDELKPYQAKLLVLYDFSGGHEVFAAANTLVKNGFSNVHVLIGGLFNIRWTAANVEGMKHLHGWIENIPEENR